MTSYFTIQGNPERKRKRNNLHRSGEIASKKKDLKKMECKCEMKNKCKLHENLKLGDYKPINFKKLSTFKVL